MWKAFVITTVGWLAAAGGGGALAGIIRDYPDHRYQHQQLSSASSHSHSRESYLPTSARLEQSPQSSASSSSSSSSGAQSSPSLHGDHDHAAEPSKIEHKHKIKHEHATSHQTFKIHHFHPVAVYVKKEDQHLLKHPIEIGGVNHKLKQIHPEAVKSHAYGYVLENHTDQKHKYHHQHHEEQAPAIGVKHAAEQIAHLHDFSQHAHDANADGLGPLQFHDINVRSGGGSPFE